MIRFHLQLMKVSLIYNKMVRNKNYSYVCSVERIHNILKIINDMNLNLQPVYILEINRKLNITHSYLTEVVNNMVGYGLIKQVVPSCNKRQKLLSLTKKGIALYNALKDVYENENNADYKRYIKNNRRI